MPIFVRTSFAASDWPSASSAFISRWCALRYAGLVSTARRALFSAFWCLPARRRACARLANAIAAALFGASALSSLPSGSVSVRVVFGISRRCRRLSQRTSSVSTSRLCGDLAMTRGDL